MGRTPPRCGSGLLRKRLHSISPVSPDMHPERKCGHHSMPAVPTAGRISSAQFFCSCLAGAAKCVRCFPGRLLYSFPSATISLCIPAHQRKVVFDLLGAWGMPNKVGRREFLALFGGALGDRAIPANAQGPVRVRTVGVLMGFANDAEAKARTEAFERGLDREGWSLGRNLRIEYRYAEGDSVRMQALAQELVELKPDCILAQSTPVSDALMRATRTIPIVFVAVSDPIGSGFVASMARPGGNITGFTVLHASIAGKYLAILKEMVPQLVRVAIMYNPNSVPAGGKFFSRPFIESATKLKVRPITAEVHDKSEIENAVTTLGRESESGLILVPDNFMSVHRDLIISLTAQFRIPAIYRYRYFAEAGASCPTACMP
ncbi:MAG: hypothetical protein E6G76_19810 [Alphaproteobacteria bacterium]|nr:MAG: hypothetical protein E6G76_19810 [Alphaproteobacteria bacterium]